MKTLAYFKLFFTLFLGLALSFGGHATKWVVQVSNFQFSPSSLPNVNLGDTIRWKWVSGSHTTTSMTIPAGASSWDSPINSTITSFEYVPAVTGTYNYKCTPHFSMGMTGTFTVSGVTPTLIVTPSNQNVTKPAGSTDFSVVSNTDWTASSNSTWCTVTPSGTGNGTLMVSYTDNSSGPPRVATIMVTVSGLTPQTVTVSQDGTTGIADKLGNKFILYPNPTSGIVNIVPGDPSNRMLDLTLMNITGGTIQHEIVDEGSQFSIDLSANPNGTYLFQIKTENGIVTKKVILSK